MAIPDFQSIMLPLLKLFRDGKTLKHREMIDLMADHFDLSEEERNELLPSGRTPRFNDRVSWAATYLKKAILLKTIQRGIYIITDRGMSVLENPPPKIDIKFLEQYPEFIKFRTRKPKNDDGDGKGVEDVTPEESIEEGYQKIRQELADEILDTVRNLPPSFFERLVVDLLVNMGYGGTRRDAGKAIGKSGDEGIDGIINEDRLGLDIVYIQAKKWDAPIGRPEIQKFAGALQGQKARKGVFITTSNFTKGAMDYVSRIESKIILIDGEMLSQLMIDYNLGVTTESVYELKRIDSDYFEG